MISGGVLAPQERRIAAFRDWILQAVGRDDPSPAVTVAEHTADSAAAAKTTQGLR